MSPNVQPLSYKHRNLFFYTLVTIFAAALPFLFLYASGYRFNLGETGLISTGGLYVAADKTGAQIYINDELVRETRVFRRAFYAQGLEASTHRVHVQKEDNHTWVKELPVYSHLVTEAQAFNLPLLPNVRVVTSWNTATGVPVLTATSTVLQSAEASNQILYTPRANPANLTASDEYEDLLEYFATSTIAAEEQGVLNRMQTALDTNNATSTETIATTTKEWRGVKLYEAGEEVYATFVGSRSAMPYYYCAPPFPRYQPATSTVKASGNSLAAAAEANTDIINDNLELEVQTVADTDICDPTIKLDRGGENVSYFDFFPGSTDLVVLGEESGIYLVEIDDRSWQNRQPILLGDNLDVRVENGAIYAYDGEVIYEVQLADQTWF